MLVVPVVYTLSNGHLSDICGKHCIQTGWRSTLNKRAGSSFVFYVFLYLNRIKDRTQPTLTLLHILSDSHYCLYSDLICGRCLLLFSGLTVLQLPAPCCSSRGRLQLFSWAFFYNKRMCLVVNFYHLLSSYSIQQKIPHHSSLLKLSTHGNVVSGSAELHKNLSGGAFWLIEMGKHLCQQQLLIWSILEVSYCGKGVMHWLSHNQRNGCSFASIRWPPQPPAPSINKYTGQSSLVLLPLFVCNVLLF